MNRQKFMFWCYKILPLVYDDSLSYYEVLCRIVKYVNDIIEQEKEYGELIEQLSGDVNQLKSDVATLEAEIEKIKNGEYVSVYIDALSKWIDQNLQELVGKIVKYVFFGLSNDGHFVAHIPESWNFIQFDTIMDTSSDYYGHLVMQW